MNELPNVQTNRQTNTNKQTKIYAKKRSIKPLHLQEVGCDLQASKSQINLHNRHPAILMEQLGLTRDQSSMAAERNTQTLSISNNKATDGGIHIKT